MPLATSVLVEVAMSRPMLTRSSNLLALKLRGSVLSTSTQWLVDALILLHTFAMKLASAMTAAGKEETTVEMRTSTTTIVVAWLQASGGIAAGW
jgi:hypothetical protein